MKVGYVRVSTIDQNEARQIEGLKKYDIDKWYVEKISGKNTDRPELQKMLNDVSEGDTIYIHDFSRLSRSTKDLLAIVETLNENGIHLVSNKENLDTSTATGKLMLTMIAAINEFERTNLLERQAEGIAIAKAKGTYKGGHPKNVDDTLFNDNLNKYNSGAITKSQFAENIGVSRPTLNKLLLGVA